MEGGRGEVGYKIVVESAIDICILSIILSNWPTCSNEWQTMHRRPIADDLAVFDVEMLEKWWLGNSAFSPRSDLPGDKQFIRANVAMGNDKPINLYKHTYDASTI